MLHRRSVPGGASVCAGMMVTDPSTGTSAVLGVLAREGSTGSLVGLTAAFSASRGAVILCLATSERIGVAEPAWPKPAAKRGPRTIADTLCVIRLDSNVRVSAPAVPGPFNGQHLDDVTPEVGELVFKGALMGADYGRGRLSTVNCTLHLEESRSGKVDDFTGAAEVTDLIGQPAFARSGDAGSPVLSRQGHLLGLVIGGLPTRTFIAPIGTFLREQGLSIAKLAAFEHHNAAIGPQRSPRSVVPVNTMNGAFNVIGRFGEAVEKEAPVYEPTAVHRAA